MNKIIKCILGCMLVFMVSGCSVNDGRDQTANINNSDVFKLVDKDFDGSEKFVIVYHKETKVMYVIVEYYKSIGITPLLNPDGMPMLYEEKGDK